METRSTKQKPRETEEQEKIQILQEEELEEPTKSEEKSNNCKEDKLMQMLLQMNNAMINKFEENNQKFEETNKKLEEINQKLEKKIINNFEKIDQKLEKKKTEMDQSMEKIQRLFNTMQEKIDEKWEKNYVEFDCKMVEITEQVDNNSGHINGNCKDLKEQIKEIVDDVEEKTKIVNKMIMNYEEGEYRNFQEPQMGFMKNY
ncbi:hypothetical protein FQA39_LY10639 [Lamprigera yunnana]|nr:hypothetical protein FQA39_LY10639 [Lamprigera yunnana]